MIGVVGRLVKATPGKSGAASLLAEHDRRVGHSGAPGVKAPASARSTISIHGHEGSHYQLSHVLVSCSSWWVSAHDSLIVALMVER